MPGKQVSATDEFTKGLWRDNPVFVQVLGMCPALAVSNTAINALTMGLATTFVLHILKKDVIYLSIYPANSIKGLVLIKPVSTIGMNIPDTTTGRYQQRTRLGYTNRENRKALRIY